MARLLPLQYAINYAGMSDEDISILSLRTAREYYRAVATALAAGVTEAELRAIERDAKEGIRTS